MKGCLSSRSNNRAGRFLGPNAKKKNNNKSAYILFLRPRLFFLKRTDRTTAAAAATSPTGGSEGPRREILFVPAVQVGHVFQQDIPTEGEVNYEQTGHNGMWSWIWRCTKRWSYSLKILPSPPLSGLWELIKHWTAWGHALATSEKEGEKILFFNYPDLTVRWIHYCAAPL